MPGSKLARPPDLSGVRRTLGVWRIAHRAQFRDANVTPRQLRYAVERNVVRRVRRDWFAAPDCDPALVRAAHAGATLACVSAAATHGLWELDGETLHVSAARSTPRLHRDAPWPDLAPLPLSVHWTRRPDPRLAPRVRELIVPVPKALAQVARCQPLERAVAVVDSALRRKKITLHELKTAAESERALARLLEHVDASADSELETLARVRLAKREIVMITQVVIDGHSVDGLIGTRLILQLDGHGPHAERVQRNRDLRQDERLRRRGFVVLRFSGDQVRWEWPMVESAVLSVVASGRHLH